MEYKHFSVEEREMIQMMWWERKSKRAIAKVLGRSHTSVAREMKKNFPKERKVYSPRLAEIRAHENRKKRGREERLKNEAVRSYVIPIHNVKGEVVAYAGRFPGEPPDEDTEKYKLPPGFRKMQELFNIDRAIKEPGPLIIVEGFFGCMKIHQAGYRNVVALMGSTMSAAQEELIRRYSHVILMLDEDEAGRTARAEIAARLARFAYVKIHAFEQEGQQPDKLNAEEMAQLIGGIR